jgi:hypothetical protein
MVTIIVKCSFNFYRTLKCIQDVKAELLMVKIAFLQWLVQPNTHLLAYR